GRQRDRGRARAVDDADDEGPTATVLEELLESVGKRRGLPESATDLLEFGQAGHGHRLVDRSLQRAADEGRDSSWHALNRVLRHSALFCEFFYAGNTAFSHVEPL